MATPHAGASAGGRRYKFFKVLLPGTFELYLSIPPKFAAVRDATGRWWDVELHRDGDHGRLLLTGRGWRGFVSANGVSAGHLLVFEHRGCLDSAVDLFDASGCLSESSACRCENNEDGVDLNLKAAAASSSMIQEATGGDNKEEPGPGRRPGTAGGVKRKKPISPMARASSSTATTTGTGFGGDDETLLCRRIDRPYQLRFLDLSKSFCDAVGWMSSRDVELIICAAAGDDEQRRRSWPVSVKVSTKSGMMCAGWTEFARDNGLGLSDACVFVPPLLQHSHGTSVIQVRVIRGSASHAADS